MTKQELIEFAWKDLYKEFAAREAIDSEGYVNWGDYNIQDVCEHPSEFGFNPETDIQWNGTKWRPISLMGLHDNNGWHKIVTIEDLPTKEGFYRTIDKNSGYVNSTARYANNAVICKNWLRQFSHWKEIPFEPKPLY